MRMKRGHWNWAASLACAGAAGLAFLGFQVAAPARTDAACCYFAAKDKDINQPGQKAFVTWDAESQVETFTVQPKFEGNAVDFGMVIPTPAQPKLDEMPKDFFKDLAIYTILMPLPEQIWIELTPEPAKYELKAGAAMPEAAAMRDEARGAGVRILESGVVGSLDYKILEATKADDLYQWLKDHQYSYAGDEATLDFYIQKKWYFTVMKIDPKQMKKAADGSYLGEVTPTKFTFKTEKCIYPLKITQLSVKDQTDALFYVQSKQQMDLTGELSWQHSYRPMYITYMLGCGAGADLQQELQQRNQWVAKKKQADPKFETTKLEWARKLTAADLSVLDDPLKNYAQAGGGDLPAGGKKIELKEFITEVKAQYEKNHGKWTEYASNQIKHMEDRYQPDNGMIVKYDEDTLQAANKGGRFIGKYMWYPNRKAPDEEVKGLMRLKGHLQEGQYLTKFRKILRKDEMTDDLELVAVPDEKVQSYVRIMPTSPP